MKDMKLFNIFLKMLYIWRMIKKDELCNFEETLLVM